VAVKLAGALCADPLCRSDLA